MARVLSPRTRGQRPALAAWWAVVLFGATLLIVTGRGSLGALTWRQPGLFFWVVVMSAGLCVLGAAAVLYVAWRANLAELGILGGALWVLSTLPLVHGLTAPGYLYGGNTATAVSVFVALPLGTLCGLPLLAPNHSWAISIGQRWRRWAGGWVMLASATSVVLLVAPRRFPAPQLGSPTTLVVVGVSMSLFLVLSLRQLRLYWIGRRPASLWASLGVATVAIADLVWIDSHAYSISWWLAHAIDTIGVLLAVVSFVVGPRPARSVSAILAPVLDRDPLSAFALGLSPTIHKFVAALDDKDQTTRDHVVRVGELAMRSGTRADLPAPRLRALGIGALLHDIGKLATPDEILRARRGLSEAEFEVVKEHPCVGEAILRGSPELAHAAPLVRWHHERYDGGGYPDGIGGDLLPIEVGIISVVDAFDAMTNDRHYRDAMSVDDAIAVLHQHSGSQWDPRCVGLVIREIKSGGVSQHPLAVAGSAAARDGSGIVRVCVDALPVAARDRVQASSPSVR